ncbi:MAG: tetratricopeptide repeat protein [Gammaproteobacteria bacterium]
MNHSTLAKSACAAFAAMLLAPCFAASGVASAQSTNSRAQTFAAPFNQVPLAQVQQAAKHGNARAQFFLGKRYYNGSGVRQNFARAAYWFHKAAARGITGAQYDLARMYYKGRGVPQDNTNAFYWYRQAANGGDAKAQAGLGLLYLKGLGAPKDYAKALYWPARRRHGM